MIQLIKLSDYDTISTINNEITSQGDNNGKVMVRVVMHKTIMLIVSKYKVINNMIQLLKRTQEIHFAIYLSITRVLLFLDGTKRAIWIIKKGKYVFKNFPKTTK